MHTYVIDEHSYRLISICCLLASTTTWYILFSARTAHFLFFLLYVYYYFYFFTFTFVISRNNVHGVNLKLSHRIVNVNSIIAQNKPLTTLYKYSIV